MGEQDKRGEAAAGTDEDEKRAQQKLQTQQEQYEWKKEYEDWEDNRRIYVRIKADGRNFFLSVRNPFDRPRKQENGKYLTGKMVDGEVHGLGLAIVQCIVDKYEGQMEIHEEGQVFEVSVVLYDFFE